MKLNKVQQEPPISPIFELGTVPGIPYCVIQERRYEGGEWMYYIRNNYNSYASGWGNEDFLIAQIKKYGK